MPAPVLSVAQMRAWETASWQAGRSEAEVIARVGSLLAARLRALTRPGDRLLLLAGQGHNGDDARAAVIHLRDREVDLLTVRDPESGLAELREALARRPAWIVDGLFGIGLNRPLSPAWLALIEAINASAMPILAVDVPSGLNAQTGETFGAAVRAQITITAGAPKIGLLQPAAWPYTGRLVVEPDIGLIPAPGEAELWWTLPVDFAGFPPAPGVVGHKGDRGHLFILAGSPGYHGAAVLAARAAQRARPGLITLGTTPETYLPAAAQLQAVMVDHWPSVLARLPRASACLAGPGLAAAELPAALREAVIGLWRTATVPVVADASALDWLPAGRETAPAPRVITPHPGEAARLLGVSPAAVQRDRPAAVRTLSQSRGGCWVVLKGFQTLIGRERGPVWVNSSGDAALAQGGTGDVLAGFLAGLLAQPKLAADAEHTLRYAVWWHGAAADQLSAATAGWIPDELAAALGAPAG
jgi:NAD(P)H-hydrate epimerase